MIDVVGVGRELAWTALGNLIGIQGVNQLGLDSNHQFDFVDPVAHTAKRGPDPRQVGNPGNPSVF